MAVSVHFTLDEAIRGASFVLTQLRVGQLAARAADERLGLKYHLLARRPPASAVLPRRCGRSR